MEKEPKEQTQTTPKGAKIPLPKRGEFFRNLEKVAPREAPSGDKPGSPEK